MKFTDKQTGLWTSAQTLDKLREEVRQRISREELDHSWQLEALDQIITLVQLDPASFHRLWLRPLLAAGASLDTALVSIAESYFRPN